MEFIQQQNLLDVHGEFVCCFALRGKNSYAAVGVCFKKSSSKVKSVIRSFRCFFTPLHFPRSSLLPRLLPNTPPLCAMPAASPPPKHQTLLLSDSLSRVPKKWQTAQPTLSSQSKWVFIPANTFRLCIKIIKWSKSQKENQTLVHVLRIFV